MQTFIALAEITLPIAAVVLAFMALIGELKK